MSEFKFACPVCGQHITADSAAAGTQIECPTCFRNIVVPQPPEAGETKLILSASQAGKARPITTPDVRPALHGFKPRYIPIIIPLLVVIALGVVAYVYRAQLVRLWSKPPALPTVFQSTPAPAPPPPVVVHPIPTNILWTLDPAAAVIPESTVAGVLRKEGFLCERATLTGGNLFLREGSGAERGVNVHLFAKAGEELAGKNIEVTPDHVPPQPRMILRWKDQKGKRHSRNFASGYLLRLVFGQPIGGKMPGKIFLALPDQSSVLAGTFVAEIRKPPPPKPKTPKVPKAPAPATQH